MGMWLHLIDSPSLSILKLSIAYIETGNFKYENRIGRTTVAKLCVNLSLYMHTLAATSSTVLLPFLQSKQKGQYCLLVSPLLYSMPFPHLHITMPKYAISPFPHNNAKVCHFHFHTYQWQSMPFPRSHISMPKYAIPHSHITMPKYAISPFSHINAKVCHFPILTYQCQSMPFLHFNVKVCHCPFPCKKPNYAIAPSRH